MKEAIRRALGSLVLAEDDQSFDELADSVIATMEPANSPEEVAAVLRMFLALHFESETGRFNNTVREVYSIALHHGVSLTEISDHPQWVSYCKNPF